MSKLILQRWHGPGYVLGTEGKSAVYVSYRGNVTKCAPEAVRMASSFERLSRRAWEECLEEVAGLDRDEPEADQERPADEEAMPVVPEMVTPPITNSAAAG